MKRFPAVFFLSLTAALILLPGASSALFYDPPSISWIARYDGTSSGDDVARAVAVGEDGFVYVTGYCSNSASGVDFVTIKYDTEGNEEWVRFYNGPGNGIDRAVDIGLDGSGNVFVTGYSFGSSTDYDYATIKYDSNGNLQWVQRYCGIGGSGIDMANALVIDGAGCCIVTGRSSNQNEDWATVKYDTDGSELWVKRWECSGSDVAYDVGADTWGNVYVTGNYHFDAGGCDCLTIKYSPDGEQLWYRTYTTGGPSYSESGFALAVDNQGNIITTGYFGSSSYPESHSNYLTLKYSPAGAQLWLMTYYGPGSYSDWAQAVAVDDLRFVYVTGVSYGSGTLFDYATIKYSPIAPGQQLWLMRYDGPGGGHDYAEAVALDETGDVYVTGYSMGIGTDYDFATLKYSSDGNELWVARYNNTIVNGDDQARAMAVGPSGSIVVAGYSEGNGTGMDLLTIRYDQGLGIEPGGEAGAPSGVSGVMPNPFESCTTVSFTNPVAGPVSLMIFDLSGRLVDTLSDGFMTAGEHSVVFDGSGLVPGVYLIRLSGSSWSSTFRIARVR